MYNFHGENTGISVPSPPSIKEILMPICTYQPRLTALPAPTSSAVPSRPLCHSTAVCCSYPPTKSVLSLLLPHPSPVGTLISLTAF